MTAQPTLAEFEHIWAKRAADHVIARQELEAHGNAIVASFRDLPAVINGPGDYVTRDGRRATIEPSQNKITGDFAGYVWKEFRGKLAPRGFRHWNPNGRRNFLSEKGSDIVGKWAT